MLLQDVPPFCLLHENVISGPNIIGLRRAGMSNQSRLAIRKAIRKVYFEGLNLKNAIEQIEAGTMTPETTHLVNFLKEAHRGIMPGNPKFSGGNDDSDSAEG